MKSSTTHITCLATLLLASSCSVFGSLNSNTSIKPNETFVLGKNQHNAFKTYLKNEGTTTLKIYQAPINGGTHSPVVIKPKETATIKTAKIRH